MCVCSFKLSEDILVQRKILNWMFNIATFPISILTIIELI